MNSEPAHARANECRSAGLQISNRVAPFAKIGLKSQSGEIRRPTRRRPRSEQRQHGRQGPLAVCDCKPRQTHSLNIHPPVPSLRQAFGVSAKIDDETDHSAWLVRQPQDTEASHLEPTRDGLGRAYQQTPACGLHMDTVIADEPREPQRTGAGSFDQIKHEARFSSTGRSADQHRACACQHRRGVNGR
jgi:hypothetical protein